MTVDHQAMLGGRYRIEDRRTGGFSVVHKAVDEKIQRTVAIKTPNESILHNEASLAKFVEEARKLAKLNHPNIIEVLHFYEVGEIDDSCHIVMEWMEHSLQDRIADDSLNAAQKLEIIDKILSGVRYIHENHVVHGDLKPANIFLSEDNQKVKIGDLGIARDIGEEHTSMATFKYCAPEHYITDYNVNEQADIYSLGLLCYELLAGRENFQNVFSDIYQDSGQAKQDTRWLNWHLDRNRSAPPLAELGMGISDNVSAAVEKMLCKEPDKRFRSIAEVQQALKTDASVSTDEIVPIELEEERPKKKKSMLLGWVAVVLLIAASIGIYLYTQRDQTTDQDVVAVSDLVKKARAAAVAAGADDPLLQPFERGDEQYANAKQAYKKYERRQAIELLMQAKASFEAAESLAYQNRYRQLRDEAEQLLTALNRYQVDQSATPLADSLRQLQKAGQAFEAQAYQAAVQSIQPAYEGLKESLMTLPRVFQQGSTEQEISTAIQLCERFQKQCKREWYDSEQATNVTLAPFEIDSHEVTNREFAAFIKASNYRTDAERLGYSYIWDGQASRKTNAASWKNIGGQTDSETVPDLPVVHISFNDAKAYCKWKQRRLPSEAEFEYAGRSIQRNLFAWGNVWKSGAVLWQQDSAKLLANVAVGSYMEKNRHPLGSDYSGSVWEWVTDNQDLNKGLLKGGSFLESNPANFRIATQRISDLQLANNDDGFRCARTLDRWPQSMRLH